MKHIYLITIIGLIGLTGVGFARDLNLQTNTQQSANVSKVNIIDKLNKQVAVLTKEVSLLKKKIKQLESSMPEGFVKTKDNRYVFSANGAKLEVGRMGEVTIKASKDLKLESALSTKIEAGSHIDFTSSAPMNIRSTAMMNINAPTIRFNNGSKPVTHMNSEVTGGTSIGGHLINGKIMQGSPSVLVP